MECNCHVVTWSTNYTTLLKIASFQHKKVLEHCFSLLLFSNFCAVSVRKVIVLLFSTLPSHRQVLCFSMYLYFFPSSIRYCWVSSSGPYRFPGHFLLNSNELRTKETVAAMCFAVLFVFHSQILPHAWVRQIDQPRK